MDSTWAWSCIARQNARRDSEDDGGGAVAKYLLGHLLQHLLLGIHEDKARRYMGQITNIDIAVVFFYTPDWGTNKPLG